MPWFRLLFEFSWLSTHHSEVASFAIQKHQRRVARDAKSSCNLARGVESNRHSQAMLFANFKTAVRSSRVAVATI
jgi:hypothetical protein